MSAHPKSKALQWSNSTRRGTSIPLQPENGASSKSNSSPPNTEAGASTPTLIHSGDAGDLIYALPAMRWATKGQPFNLILGKKQKVRAEFTEAWANNLIPLLKIQGYIKDIWIQRPDDHWTLDIDPFRERLLKRHVRGKSITAYVCDVIGAPYSCSSLPWLSVDYPVHVDGCPVVVNRTTRYNNPLFPWKRIMQAYRGQMVFVGHTHEWERFCNGYGDLPYCPTDTALDLARMIAGCRLFIGNQSMAYAVAEGLKQNTIQETSPRFPDCIFPRQNSTICINGKVVLPRLESLS